MLISLMCLGLFLAWNWVICPAAWAVLAGRSDQWRPAGRAVNL